MSGRAKRDDPKLPGWLSLFLLQFDYCHLDEVKTWKDVSFVQKDEV